MGQGVKLTVYFGPPGTGKTRTLVEVIGSLPLSLTHDTAIISFSKASAKELTERVQFPERFAYVGTLHALCFKALSMTKSQVATADKFKYHISDTNDLTSDDDTDRILEMGGLLRRTGHELHQLYDMFPRLMTITDRSFHFVWGWYLNWKKAYYLRDFDDMLADANPGPYSVVIVDEAQDLSPLQWACVKRMVKPNGQLIIAGDDDQAIYTWAGADPHGMRRIMGEARGNSEVNVLAQSHRVPRSVHQVALATIGQIKERQKKQWEPRQERGNVSFTQQLPMWGDKPYLVLCRDRYTMMEVEADLMQEGIPYHKEGAHGQSLYDGRLMRMWDLWLNDKEQPHKKILEKYGRMLSPAGVEAMEDGVKRDDFALEWGTTAPMEHIAYVMYVLGNTPGERLIDRPTPNAPTLSTIHGQKGKEADHVVLIAKCSPAVDELRYDELQFDDEVRVWYTGITRARKTLTVVGNNDYIREES